MPDELRRRARALGITRPAWLLAAIVVAVYGVTSTAGALEAVLSEHEWWRLPTLPVWTFLYALIVIEAMRRARSTPGPPPPAARRSDHAER